MDPRDTAGHVHLLPPQVGHVALSQARCECELRRVSELGSSSPRSLLRLIRGGRKEGAPSVPGTAGPWGWNPAAPQFVPARLRIAGVRQVVVRVAGARFSGLSLRDGGRSPPSNACVHFMCLWMTLRRSLQWRLTCSISCFSNYQPGPPKRFGMPTSTVDPALDVFLVGPRRQRLAASMPL